MSTLISIGVWAATKIADKGFDNIYNKIIGDKTLNTKFYSAVSKVSKNLQNKYPDVLGDSIEYFFKKEEIFSELFKLLFRSSTTNCEKISNLLDIATLPKDFVTEFVLLLKDELLKDRTFDEIFSNNEIYVLFQGLSLNIKEIAFNSTITLSEITRISTLLEQKIGAVFDYNHFIYVYTKNATNNLSQVNFIGLGIDISIKKNRKDLEDIFVRPLFEFADLKYPKNTSKGDYQLEFERKRKIIDYKNLLNISDRIVILGNPGAGKSILIKSLICDILRKNSNEFKNKNLCEYIPFRIELRNYLAFKKEHKGNLLKYLIFMLEHEYQISNVTETILNTILNRKCLLFFDGLDEIFDLSDKVNVKNDIENFQTSYPKIKSVVTSRIIGYEEANLNKTFTEIHILNFNDDQINAYVNQWYSKEEEIEDIRIREVDGFLNKKHEIDRELITNPLLLSLIVILYRNILKLPESKLEIYQSCTKTLVDKWDASKELKIDLDENIYKAKDKLFADLAYWQYKELSGKTDRITYEKAKTNISNSLLKLGIADEYSSDELSEKFMVYAQKRSIYFENNFTHKTFLEYYAAYWIYSNIEKKHKVVERNELISLYIGNSFWFIVFELLFNLIDKDQADNDIMDELFEFLLDENLDSLRFLLSVSFKIKNISSKNVEKTIQNTIKFLLNTADEADVSKKNIKRNENSVYTVFKTFFLSEEISSEIIVKQFYNLFETSGHDYERLEKLYILYLEPTIVGRGKRTLLLKNDSYKKCCDNNPYLFILDYYSSFFEDNGVAFEKLIRFIDLFGVDSLFKSFQAIYDNFHMGYFFQTLSHFLISKDELKNLKNNLIVLQDHGLGKARMLKYFSEMESMYINSTITSALLENIKVNTDLDSVQVISLCLLNAKENLHRFDDKSSFEALIENYRHLDRMSIILSHKTKKQKIKEIINLKKMPV